MRAHLFLLTLLVASILAACGTEDADLNPPVFSNLTAVGSFGTTDLLNQPSRDETVVLSGTLDDPAATVEVEINGSKVPAAFALAADGSWTLSFNPAEGTNTVSLTASDRRGNINQLALSLIHDGIPPTVTAISPAEGTPVNKALEMISVTFSETLKADPPAADFSIDGRPVRVAYDPTTRVATLTVDPPLGNGDHKLIIGGSGGISDPVGNIMAARPVSFTVAIPEQAQ